MDFDEVSIPGLVFALIAFGVGIIVANSMGVSLFMRILAGIICAIVGYLVGGNIADG